MKMLLRYSILALLLTMNFAMNAQFKVSTSIQEQNDIKGGWYVVDVDPNVSGLTPEAGIFADVHCVDTVTNLRYFYNYVSQGWDTLAAVETAFGNGLFDANNEGDTVAIATYNQNQDLVQQTNGNQWEVNYTDGARTREMFIRDDQIGFEINQGDGDLFRFRSTYLLGQHSTIFETIDDGSQAELSLSGAQASLNGDNGTDFVRIAVDADGSTGIRVQTKGGAANDEVLVGQDGSGNIEYEPITNLMSLSVTSPTDSTRQFNISSAGQTINSNIFSVKGGSGGGGGGGGDDWGVQTVASDATLTGDGAGTALSVNEGGLSIGFGQITGFPSDLADGDNFLASRALVIAGAGGQAQFDLSDNNASNMTTLNFVGGNGVEFSDNLGRLQIDFDDTFLDNRSLFQSGSTSEFRLLDNDGNIMTGITFLEGNGVTFSNNLGRLEISATEYWSRNSGVLSPVTSDDQISLNGANAVFSNPIFAAKSINTFASNSKDDVLVVQSTAKSSSTNGGQFGIAIGENDNEVGLKLYAKQEGFTTMPQLGFSLHTVDNSGVANERFSVSGLGLLRANAYNTGTYEIASLGSNQRFSIFDADGSFKKLPISGIISNDANNGVSVGSDGLLYATVNGSGDGNDFVSSASFNTSDGVLTLSGSGGAGATVDIDGRYDESTSNELQTISKAGNTVTLSNGGGSFTDATESFWTQSGNNISYSTGEVSIGGTNDNASQLELLGGYSTSMYVEGEYANFTLSSDETTLATTLNSYTSADALQSSINMSDDEVNFSDSGGTEYFSSTPSGMILTTIPEYANEAAANADNTLVGGSLYQVVGSDALYRKK